jgi:hypothetical protein
LPEDSPPPSGEQHRKSRTSVFIAALDQQFAANSFDKGSMRFTVFTSHQSQQRTAALSPFSIAIPRCR